MRPCTHVYKTKLTIFTGSLPINTTCSSYGGMYKVTVLNNFVDWHSIQASMVIMCCVHWQDTLLS